MDDKKKELAKKIFEQFTDKEVSQDDLKSADKKSTNLKDKAKTNSFFIVVSFA